MSSVEIQGQGQLNEAGRVVIPAEIRKRLGLNAGDTLFFRVQGEVLIIESQQTRIRRVQESLSRLLPAGRSLADELITERREEARREEARREVQAGND